MLLPKRKPPKDRDNFIKIDEFYYPLDFYEIHNHYYLRNALLLHFKHQAVMENYNYLLAVQDFSFPQVHVIYNTYVKPGAPQEVNIKFKTRTEAGQKIEEFDYTHKPNLREGNYCQQRVKITNSYKTVFDDVTKEVRKLVRADHIGDSTAGKFWSSLIFRKVHNWRRSNLWRFWLKTGVISPSRLSKQAYNKLVKESSNNQITDPVAAGLVSEEQWANFFDFNNNH